MAGSADFLQMSPGICWRRPGILESSAIGLVPLGFQRGLGHMNAERIGSSRRRKVKNENNKNEISKYMKMETDIAQQKQKQATNDDHVVSDPI